MLIDIISHGQHAAVFRRSMIYPNKWIAQIFGHLNFFPVAGTIVAENTHITAQVAIDININTATGANAN